MTLTKKQQKIKDFIDNAEDSEIFAKLMWNDINIETITWAKDITYCVLKKWREIIGIWSDCDEALIDAIESGHIKLP